MQVVMWVLVVRRVLIHITPLDAANNQWSRASIRTCFFVTKVKHVL